MAKNSQKPRFMEILLVVLLAVYFLGDMAVAFSELWSKTYGGSGRTKDDLATSLVATADGGFAIAGYTHSFDSRTAAWLVRVDANGGILWNRTYAGTSAIYVLSLVELSDGGFAMAGYTGPFFDYADFWVAKTDSHGNMLWNKTYRRDVHQIAYSLVETSDGGLAIAGYTGSWFTGHSDFWLVKTDASGNMLWNQTYGGADIDGAYSLVATADGGFVIAGYTCSFGAGSEDAWVVRVDACGRLLWDQKFGGVGFDHAEALVVTSDGGLAIAGSSRSFGAGFMDFWLVKTDANGNMLWNQTYGGANEDVALSLVELSDGGFALVGYTESFGAGNRDAWVVRVDACGRLLWDQKFGGVGFDHAEALVVTSDGGLVIAGYTNSFSGLDYDFWLVRTVSGTVPAPKPEPESDSAILFTTAGVIMAVAVIVAGVAVIFRLKKIRERTPCSLK